MSHLEDAINWAISVGSWLIAGNTTSLTDVYQSIGSTFV